MRQEYLSGVLSVCSVLAMCCPFALGKGVVSLSVVRAPSVQAQSQDKFARELKFIKGLAKNWGFIALASEHLEELRKEAQAEPGSQRILAQVDAEILYHGAKRMRDLPKKQATLRKALESFDDYIAQYGDDAESAEVRATYAEACEFYGRFLSDSISIEKDPDKKKILEDEALDIFIKGIKASNEAMAALEGKKDSSTKAKVAYYLSWMRKGTIQREWAKTIENDRKTKAEEAIETLEDLAMEAGEETALGMKAMLEGSVATWVLGNIEEATEMFVETNESIVERLADVGNPLPASTALLLFRFLEQSYYNLTAIYLQSGQTDEIIAAIDKYLGEKKKFGYETGLKHGDMLLLNGAEALFSTGETAKREEALDRARWIAKRHMADFVGLKAKNLIKEIISGASGATVSAEALFQAADGDYLAKKYEDAIRGFKRVLRNLTKAEDQKTYGLKAWAKIGNSFFLRKRYLEAFFAFKAGIEAYGAGAPDRKKTQVIDYMTRVARLKKRETAGDAAMAKLVDIALAIQMRSGGSSANQAFWNKAEGARQDQKFTDAVASYSRIKKDYFKYELARVRIGVCQYYMKENDAVKRTFDKYFTYIKDPLNEPEGANRLAKTTSRLQAIAEARFYLGRIVVDASRKEPAKLKDVVTQFRGFRKMYQTVPSLGIRADFYLIRALVGLEKLEDAEAAYKSLRKDHAKNREVSMLAMELFGARQTLVKALKTEMIATKGDSKGAKTNKLKNRFRVESAKALAFGKSYMDEMRVPNFEVLRMAASMAQDIEDWDLAALFLEKIVKVHGTNEKYERRIDQFVKPEYAKILLEKHDWRQASALLQDAIAARPRSLPLKRLMARALGGWSELDDKGRLRVLPGRGKGATKKGEPDDYMAAYYLLFKDYSNYIKAKYDKYTLPWYQFKFECMEMASKVARKGNSDFAGYAKIFYRQAASEDNFDTLKNLGKNNKQARDLHLLFRLFKQRI